MEDTPAFKEDKRSNSFDNSVSTIEVTTEDNISSTSPSGSMIRGMLGESNGDDDEHHHDHDNSNNANANDNANINDATAKTNINLPVMSPDTTVDSSAKAKRSRNDVTLDASVMHGHNSKRGAGMMGTRNVGGGNANANANASSRNRNVTRDTRSGPTVSTSTHGHHYPNPSVMPMPMPLPKRKKKSILEAYPMHKNASDASRNIIVQLKSLYQNRIRPIEHKFNLYNFCLPTNAEIHNSEFDAKPMVLLLGQYSTGKTTFIRHLVGGDYPSMHIGPEPTTDRFTALIHGNDDEDEEEDEDENEHEDEFCNDDDEEDDD
jgi:hypothetical protein